jgi:hypothetical protein
MNRPMARSKRAIGSGKMPGSPSTTPDLMPPSLLLSAGPVDDQDVGLSEGARPAGVIEGDRERPATIALITQDSKRE